MADPRIPQPTDPAVALESLGRMSLRDLDMDTLLRTVAELTRSVMPGDPEASVLLLVGDRPATVVSTGELASHLDETQYEGAQGPWLQAARTGEVVEITDTRADGRWPHYLARAVEQGNLSSLSVPLDIDADEHVTGALNIYARTAHAFDDASRAAASRFGPYAAVATGNLYAYRSARDLVANLETALHSRAVIDQAKGILIERYRMTADQAFQLLARASMSTNRKVRDVADHLVRTGELRFP